MENGVGEGGRPKLVKAYIGWGAGPRASEYLILAAKARAILTGSYHVTPDHIRDVCKPVLRHRILTNFNAEADQVTTDAIIDNMLKEIPVDQETKETLLGHSSTLRGLYRLMLAQESGACAAQPRQ